MSYGGLGTVYNFPQTNDSTVIPNATFRVDVPTQAIVNEAVYAAVPYVPTLVGAALQSIAASPVTLQPLMPGIIGSLTSYVERNPEALQPLLDATLPKVVETIERSSHSSADLVDSLWPLLETKLNSYVLRLAILGGAALGVAWMARKR